MSYDSCIIHTSLSTRRLSFYINRADQHQYELAALRAQVQGLGRNTPPTTPPPRPSSSSSSPPLSSEIDQLRKQIAMMEVQTRLDKDTITRFHLSSLSPYFFLAVT